MRLPLIVFAALSSAAAVAQVQKPQADRPPPDKVWTSAPVSGAGVSGVAPADRAGSLTGSDTSSPFSALPSGTRTGGGQSSPAGRDTAPNADTLTPNLSR